MDIYVGSLKAKIIQAAQDYYSGHPTLSDAEFDGLVEKLKAYSPQDELLLKTSFGYDPAQDTTGQKVAHKYAHVGSLNKINSETYEKSLNKTSGSYCISSKHDGGSGVVYYDANGLLEFAATRGDGVRGIDCTAKLKHLVPSSVQLSNVAIRGEITMKKSVFDQYYPDAASPRNTALGIIGQDNPSEEELSRLSFVAYNVYGPNHNTPKRKTEIIQWLKEQGFTTVQPMLWVFRLGENLLESLKGQLDPDYPSDGLVITSEEYPSDEIAYKFTADTAQTTVTEVEWTTSRLGAVIPVVNFNPVKLSGATLSKCSGFNAQWILDNNIRKGAVINVHRAGEVIPYIESVVFQGPKVGWAEPGECPSCGGKLNWAGVNLQCRNTNRCPAQAEGKLLLWIETLAQTDSLAENILLPFFKAMKWQVALDIYSSSISTWSRVIVESFPTKHAQKLLWQLYEKLYKTPVDPAKFFAAFGLPSVGARTSKKLEEAIGIHNYFRETMNDEKMASISRAGANAPGITSLVDNYIYMQLVYWQIHDKQGFIKKEKIPQEASATKVAITGKLSKSRTELTKEFALWNVEVVDTVTSGVAYLITDDPNSGSSKNDKARKLGVKVISENEFRAMYRQIHE